MSFEKTTGRFLFCVKRMVPERIIGMIRGVLFDMDGLMFDTERLAVDGWMEAARQLEIPLTREQTMSLRGLLPEVSRQRFIGWFGDGEIYDKGRDIRKAYVEQQIEEHGIPVKKGLFELLNYLREHGIHMAVATSTSRQSAERHWERAGVDQYFEASVCGSEVKAGKPAPDVFLTAAARIGCEPGECLVLEDSPNGVRAGRAAGCIVVMVPDLDQPDEECRALCDYVLEDLGKVIPILEKSGRE